MIKKYAPLVLSGALLMLASCATQQVAQRTDQNDDVYYSKAKAKEQAEYVATTSNSSTTTPTEKKVLSDDSYVTDQELYGDSRYSDYRNDYYGPSWSIYFGRPYYYAPGYSGGYYSYNPYNPYNHWYNPYAYGNGYWGPYSYYRSYGYGYGYGNSGYYSPRPVYTAPNYRPRPNREGDNVQNGGVRSGSGSSTTQPGSTVSQPVFGRPTRSTTGANTQPTTTTTQPSSAPARTSARPARENDNQPVLTPQKQGVIEPRQQQEPA